MKNSTPIFKIKQSVPQLFLVYLAIILTTPTNFINGQGFFGDPVLDPFAIGISSTNYSDMPFVSLVDLDNDGDLDLFNSRAALSANSICWDHVSLDYYENVGTEECPEYTFIGAQPFGLPEDIRYPTFVDIDGDGDLDLFSSTFCQITTFFYCENIGTPETPLFDGITLNNNPYGTDPTTIQYAHLRFYDMDDDGDYDAFINGRKTPSFRYQENVGSPTEPDFGAVQIDPFGLQIPGFFSPDWGVCLDWDCDGDLDILNAHSPNNSISSWDLYYYENIGSPSQPDFDEPYLTNDNIWPMTMGDLDGDGDQEILLYEFYYKNTEQVATCVTPPIADFTFLSHALTIKFTDQSTTKRTDCSPVAWLWEFNDGTTSTEQHPTHTFTSSDTFNVCLTVTDVTGTNTYCENIIVTTTGLYDPSLKSYISLYPNPVNDFLYFRVEDNNGFQNWDIELINILGQRINNKAYNVINFKNNSGQINIADLSKGLYFLKISNKDQSFVHQFMKL